jgi:hypothetical protein
MHYLLLSTRFLAGHPNHNLIEFGSKRLAQF